MARKPRIHYPGAFYHVILRGNGKQDIFFEDADRYRFYLLLQEGVERFHHHIHAFCLMTNHIHLVVEVSDLPLSRIIQNLSFRYTRWVNWRYNRCGHLFQGRYKAVLVDADAYLLELVRYVHLNPVRARMVPCPDDYPWTGHHAYLGKESIPWITTDTTLAMLSTKRDKARRAYLTFVNDGIAEERRGEFHGEGGVDSRVFGDDEFVQRAIGSGDGIPAKIGLDDVISVVCKRYSVSPEDLALPGKERVASRIRAMAAWIVQDMPFVTLRELAEKVGRDVSSLSAAAYRLHAKARSAPDLFCEKENLIVEINKCKA